VYTWQHPRWPHFHYDKQSLTVAFTRYGEAMGNVTGSLSSINPKDLCTIIAETTVSNAVDSSAIEGEHLNLDCLKFNVMKNLSVPVGGRVMRRAKEEGVASMAMTSRNTFNDPLSKIILDDLHKMALRHEIENPPLLNTLRIGDYRQSDGMQIVSGRIDNPTVHYEAPPAAMVRQEMERFIDWFNKSRKDESLTGVERAAISHLWFETIHPYEDGNGRVGRAITDKALSQDIGYPTLACLSTAILEDHSTYYSELNKASTSLDITDWVKWFTRTTVRSYEIAMDKVDRVLDKARFWQAHSDKSFNERQEQTINTMFSMNPNNFGMTPKKYMGITRCSKATATRDIAELRKRGCLTQEGKGRSVRYNLSIPCHPMKVR